MTSAEAIAALRQKLRLTQKELAERLGITEATISRYESGQREPNEQISKELSRLSLSAGMDHLKAYFEAKRQAAIINRIQTLPSAGTQRRVPLPELQNWNGRIEFVEAKLLEARNKYVALIEPQHLNAEDKKKYYEANHDLFALKGVLQDLRREIEPYIETTKGEHHAKKAK